MNARHLMLALLLGAAAPCAMAQQDTPTEPAPTADKSADTSAADPATAATSPAPSPTPSPPAADSYPTVVIADYVLGCMAANGNSYIALQQCSCSIDYIAARLPYVDYERASTVMQVQLDRGQRGLFYRDSSWAKRRVESLENLQAQSTLECF